MSGGEPGEASKLALAATADRAGHRSRAAATGEGLQGGVPPAARRSSAPRTGWRVAHRWLGLTLGLLLFVSAISGFALVYGREIDQRAHPELFASTRPGAPVRSDLYAHAVAVLHARHGPAASFTLRPPRSPHDTLWVFVDSPGWHGSAYFDPPSGALLGERAETEGLFGWLFELHSSLLNDRFGKPLLAIGAGAYLAMLASGLILWWPRQWRRAFPLRRGAGAPLLLYDLHRSGGALFGLAIAVVVASGAYMAWRPLSHAVNALAGVAAPAPVVAAPSSAPRLGADALVARARSMLPGAMLSYVSWPARNDAARPVRVRLKVADDPHPNGLGSVWLHPATGEVLATQRWNELDPGTRAFAWIYPLHIGTLGGWPQRVLNLLLALALAALAGSGVALWCLRKAARSRGRSASPAPAKARA